MTAVHTPENNGLHRSNSFQLRLAYNEMAVGQNGSIIRRDEKARCRDRFGYCKGCEGVPTLLYMIKKNRLNPLWVTKLPREAAGECAEGVCFVCHPNRDPNRRARRYGRPCSQTGRDASLSPVPQGRTSAMQRDAPLSPAPGDRMSAMQRGRAQLSARGIPMRAKSPITEASMEDMMMTTTTTAECRPSSSSTSSLRAPDDAAAATATASQSSLRSTQSAPPLAPGRERPSFPKCFVPEIMRGSSAGGAETTSARADTSRAMVSCVRADSSLSQISGSSLDSHHFGLEESKTESERDAVRVHSSENHARYSSSDSSLCESVVSAAVSAEASADSSASASLPAEAHSPTRPQHNASPAPAPAMASLTEAPAELTLSEREVDSIVEGVDSLVREMAVMEGSSEILSDIVIRTMREYSDNAVVQIYCLRVIWDICKDDENNKQAITSAGATDDIMRALEAFPENASVQEKGCGAIWSLGANTHNRVVLVRAGACARIVKALRNFIATESLIRTAIGAMRTLSPDSEAREHFSSLRASKWMAEAMVVHRSCISVQRDGCAFLSNCAVNIEKNYVTVAPLKEMDAVVQAMAQHRQEVSIMVGACFALKNYTHETKNCRTLRQCNGIGDLMIHAADFQASSDVQVDAGDIMERLQLSLSMDESLEDQAYVSLLHIVDSQATTPQAPRSILDFMRNYDWSPRLITCGLQMFRRIVDETKSMRDPQHNRLYENGMLKDILRYCEKFEQDQFVAVEACGLIATLATDEARHSSIVEAGSCCVIFKSLGEFQKNEILVKHALEALKLLSTNVEFVHQIMEKMHLVTDAIEAHPTSEFVQMNGIAVVSSLDYFQGGHHRSRNSF